MNDGLYLELNTFMEEKIESVEKETTRIDLDINIVCQRDGRSRLRFYVVPDDYKGTTHRVKFTIEKEKR